MRIDSIAIIEVREHSSIVQPNLPFKSKQDNLDALKDASRWKSLYTIAILAACITNTFLLTTIPRQNSILYPEYWYEGLLCAIAGVSFRDSCDHMMELLIFTKEQRLINMTYFTKVFVICAMAFATSYCIAFIAWTIYLGYNHPMPFVGMFLLLADIATFMIMFWFLIPSKLKSSEEFKRRVQVYLFWRVWKILQMIPKEILSIVAMTDSILQWTFPILIPMLRISNWWIPKKFVEKFPETNNEAVKFLVTSTITINYTNFVTTKLYALYQSTVYGILIVKTLLLMKACYDIFKLNKKIEEKKLTTENQYLRVYRRQKAQSLVMNEFTDAVLPLLYGIAFTLAYFGPNATLLKGVKNDYFGGKAVKDVKHIYIVMSLMFSFDVFVMAISQLFLWYFCNLNLFQAYCNMMDKYWMLFMVKLPAIAMNFGTWDINFGLDYSGDFLWITNDSRLSIICNSAEISDREKSDLLANVSVCLTNSMI